MRLHRKIARSALPPLFLLAALSVAMPAGAADYETGDRAWQAGRLADAVEAWREAAAGGDARSMLALGRRYRDGVGVPQDWVLAHMWLNLAASRGAQEAIAERNALTRDLTPDERAEAQSRARNWRPVSVGQSRETETAGGSGTVAARKAPQTPREPPPPHAVRETQRLLAALGYKPGPADGIWGARTGRAHLAFLRDAGLPDETVLSPATLQAMRIAAGNRGVLPRSGSPSSTTGAAGRTQRPSGLEQLRIMDRVGGLRKLLGGQ